MAVIENFFVCVGAQKAGTTWLARVLAKHPELFLTPVKEIHYFDHVRGITSHLSAPKRRSRYRKYHQRLWTQPARFGEHRAQWSWYRQYMTDPLDDEWYSGLFKERGGKPFAGEITPEYAIIGLEGFRHIARLAPQARVLFILRNPVSQAWSQLLHHCRSNRIDAARLSQDEAIDLLASARIAQISDYVATLDELNAVFDAAQLLTMYYEDIHADRAAALARICRFIGISFEAAMFSGLDKRFNPSQSAAMPAPVRQYLRETHRPMAEALQARLGHTPPAWQDEFAD